MKHNKPEVFMDERKPLSLEEAADFTGLQKSYLYKLTSTGKIPYYRPNGGRVYFKAEDLEAFIFRKRRAADYELSEKAEEMLSGVRI